MMLDILYVNVSCIFDVFGLPSACVIVPFMCVCFFQLFDVDLFFGGDYICCYFVLALRVVYFPKMRSRSKLSMHFDVRVVNLLIL